MDSNQPESPCGDWLHAGENLRRRISSGVYYGFAKRHGKQKSVSLKTTDKVTAKRMLKDWLAELDRLASAEAAQITFEELAARWLVAERHTLKESSARRRSGCVKSVAPAFSGLQIRNITARHCEACNRHVSRRFGHGNSWLRIQHSIFTKSFKYERLDHGHKPNTTANPTTLV